MTNKVKIAIILAAGVGSRLDSLTSDKPKCLIRVCGKPILAYQIDSYLESGIDKVILVTGHKREFIRDFIDIKYKDNKKIEIIENDIYSQSNNMYSLWLCRGFIEASDNILISNADVVFDASIIKKLTNESGNFIVTDKDSYNEEAMKITCKEGWAKSISKQIKESDSYGSSLDVYFFTKEGSSKLLHEMKQIIELDNDKNQWTEVALDNVLRKYDLFEPFCIDKEERWYEIDNESDLLNAEILFSNIETLLSKKKLFAFDLDGTIYLGNDLIDGVDVTIRKILAHDSEVKFLSNNSSQSKSYYATKLKSMGIDVDVNQIYLSTDVAGKYLQNNDYKRGYVIGTKMMISELEKYGINHTDDNPEFVLIGYDTEISYEKIETGAHFINSNLPYFATHADLVCPTPEGPIPDAGSMIEMFAKSTGKYPRVFGKPEVDMLNSIFSEKLKPIDSIFVGDRLYTDYEMANRSGIDFICVLSGETKREHIEEIDQWPRLVLPSLKSLNNFL